MLLEVLDSRHQRPRDPVLRDGKSCPSWKFMILKVELHPIRAGRLTPEECQIRQIQREGCVSPFTSGLGRKGFIYAKRRLVSFTSN